MGGQPLFLGRSQILYLSYHDTPELTPYPLPQNWCAEMRFPDGPLVNEGKFCLFFERVIEPYRVAPPPASKKRKQYEAAVPTAAEDALARAMVSRGHAGGRPGTGRGDDWDEEDAAGAPISRGWPPCDQCSMRKNSYPPRRY